ncbi:DUF5007 domain-containing protein [Niabella ginsengisoli]|uniref:DUF5007 domain-containing protein n=1 Tax=Niabella ginsengisoli TaxID=522298 RepID=A0ABS9SIY0_9BACT|nr:DUF5007 domain-containing protein [Niabella ginsengisoli]MCH5598310.1 DUF5007 domain-containing protein [Niabella ginsengisoli]
MRIKIILSLFIAVIFASGCQKKYLPRDLDSFSLESSYSQVLFNPILGRNLIYNNIFLDNDNSSKPLTFKLVNVRTYDGLPAPELSAAFPVYVWKQQYTGDETSLQEIESKRALEDHSFLEVRQHSGDIIFWGNNDVLARSVKSMPDSGYRFDIQVSNSGGSKVIKDFRIQPYIIREYEPNNADLISGYASTDWLNPSSVTNMIGDSTETPLFASNVLVSIHKLSSQGSSLKISFIDQNNEFIDPSKFNLTDWPNLLHGFNIQRTSTYIKYDVAYPIPLVERRTKYTTVDGRYAHLNFSYSRLTAGGLRQVSNMLFDFAIYTKGDWEIIISFPKESPKFEND